MARTAPFFLLLSIAMAGCGGSPSSLCAEFCECEGCSQSEEDECIDELEDEQREAEAEDCGAEYSAYLACLDAEAECRDGDNFEADGCNPEQDDLQRCLD